MTIFYVVTWNFELDDSGEVVTDGSVFTDPKSAAIKEIEVLGTALNTEFSSRRLLPILSLSLIHI